MNLDHAIDVLNSGGVGILPTDTLYGIVGRADLPETVERIYKIKGREQSKPFIILISSITDLKKFDINLSALDREVLDKNWPGKISAILKIQNDHFNYLTRGTKTLAFRLPDKNDLQYLINQTGPLVAPSANKEGDKPAENIQHAKEYFGEEVDFYIDGGNLLGESSTLISLENGGIKIHRQGSGVIK